MTHDTRHMTRCHAWHEPRRSPNGTINADPERFPGGMKSLADYIHSKGLKFGVYTAQHQFTHLPGVGIYFTVDAQSHLQSTYV